MDNINRKKIVRIEHFNYFDKLEVYAYQISVQNKKMR